MRKIGLLVLAVSFQVLQADTITTITSKLRFDEHVSSKKPILFIVAGQGCVPCMALKRWIGKQNFRRVTFLCADYHDAKHFGLGSIRAVPKIYGFKDGKQCFERIGFTRSSSNELRTQIQSLYA